MHAGNPAEPGKELVGDRLGALLGDPDMRLAPDRDGRASFHIRSVDGVAVAHEAGLRAAMPGNCLPLARPPQVCLL